MNPKVLGVNIKTLLLSGTGWYAFQPDIPAEGAGKQRTSTRKCLQRFRRVRKDLGEPPLVTPSSQIVGTQAVFNVLMGERYKSRNKGDKGYSSW